MNDSDQNKAKRQLELKKNLFLVLTPSPTQFEQILNEN